MTDVITKVAIGGVEYPFAGGGGSEGAEVVYLTQAEYDALPSSKLTDGKIYKVKTTGVVPGGSADASDVGYDNTTSGLIATDVQSAIDEVNGKVSSGTMIERGDMVFCNFNGKTETDKYIETFYHSSTGSTPAYRTVSVHNNLINEYAGTVHLMNFPGVTDYFVTYKTFVFFREDNHDGEYSDEIRKINLNDYTTQLIRNSTFGSTSQYSFRISGVKFEGDYMYCKTNASNFNYTKAPISDITNVEAITQTEYDNVQNYINSVNGLFYTQDGTDYVATDINGAEVKRYVGVGTIHGIAGGKLYRNVGDVSYAIATI